MMQQLPLTNFEWVYIHDINEILCTPDKADIGYLLEVDISYPKKIHKMHNDYPMCAEHMKLDGTNQRKLCLNLIDKSNYVLHYRTLKLIVQHGLKVTKLHRVLKFKQTCWLKPYIEKNTIERTNATNSFEKNLYKLMSNAIYGKTLENIRGRSNVTLENEWLIGKRGAMKLISKPNFKKCVIFNENLVAIEMYKTKIQMTQPIIISVCVLEISKIKMYDFHYKFMVLKFNRKCQLLYTDTDSFIYNIKCDDIYQIMKLNLNHFYTSDCEEHNLFGIDLKNKKIPGLMKDENNSRIMSEFVGLRSKMYSYKINNTEVIKKAKGIKKNILKKKKTFEQYLECIRDQTIFSENQSIIQSKYHKVYTINQNKKVLDPFDNKRYICENQINTFAYGHYKRKNM